METQNILIVGSILLCCGCLGMLIAHMSNPVLRGLRWLAWAFTAGTLAVVALLAMHAGDQGFYLLIANTLILLAYVSLHAGILEITESASLLPRLGLILLAIQATVYPAFQLLHRMELLPVVTLALILPIQALQTAAYLKMYMKKGMAASISLTIVLLIGFAAFNIFRSIAILGFGFPADPKSSSLFAVTSAIVFLATALGLGFAVFWMTSMQLRHDLEKLANTDSLTGLYNRRCFLTYCEQERLRSLEIREPLSLVMIDLDHFKQVNDLHGHKAGDAALCAVAGHLKDAVRAGDILGRWGGEEFIVLLPETCAAQALQVAQRLRLCVESISLSQPIKGRVGTRASIRLAISAGVATALGPIESIDTLLSSCDEALYCAKAAGRNTVVQRELGPEMDFHLPSMMGRAQQAAHLPAVN